ncbi:transposase [Streptomyces sp. NPDC021020]|uniref:transposase n=1 Tax=Streptomyces sp. NPDC021020 TaxID=3365109 RepID=UPI0037886C27
MLVLQFLLNLSDRQVAEAVRCRIDFKYALAMELEDPGFHHSILSDFRDRLCTDRSCRRPPAVGAGPFAVGRVAGRAGQAADRLHPHLVRGL